MAINNRRCSYCNQTGHMINNCTDDESIVALYKEVQDAADFSIAYSGVRYLKALLLRYHISRLRMLGYHMNLTGIVQTENMTLKNAYCNALKNAYFNARLAEPGIKDRLRQSLSAETVASIRQTIVSWIRLGIIQASQRDIAIERVRVAEQTVERNENMLDTMYGRLMQYQQRYNEMEQNSHIAFEELENAQEELNQLTRQHTRYRKFNIIPVLNLQEEEKEENEKEENEKEENEKEEKEEDCPICYDAIKTDKLVITNCKHSFCVPCLSKYLDSVRVKSASNPPVCALCREITTRIEFKDQTLFNIMGEKYCIKQGPQEKQVPQIQEIQELDQQQQREEQEQEIVVEWIIDRTPTPTPTPTPIAPIVN